MAPSARWPGDLSSVGGAATFREDPESFGAPMARAALEVRRNFILASARVRGAERRVREAMDDLRDFMRFSERVELHLQQANFSTLPSVRDDGGNLIERVHDLTVGPWRGRFLVSDDGLQVIGLSFQRIARHRSGSRKQIWRWLGLRRS